MKRKVVMVFLVLAVVFAVFLLFQMADRSGTPEDKIDKWEAYLKELDLLKSPESKITVLEEDEEGNSAVIMVTTNVTGKDEDGNEIYAIERQIIHIDGDEVKIAESTIITQGPNQNMSNALVDAMDES